MFHHVQKMCDVEKKWSPRRFEIERASFCARVRKVQSYYAPRARREYSEFDYVYGTLLLLRTDYCEMRGMRDKAARAEKATTRMPTATTS